MSFSAVVVSYADPEATARAVASLLAQTQPPEEIIVVDNGGHGLAGLEADVLRPGANLGFGGAVNLAAERANGDWLFVLNPDAEAEAHCLEHLATCAESSPGAAVVGAQVLLADGRTVNAGANPVHPTGLCWAGRYGEPREVGPARPVASVSGAAMAVRRDAFTALGGFNPYFFLYYEDVDLCWRALLAGWDVRFCPQAAVRHDYEFDKGQAKWGHLERHRLWSLAANYRLATLTVLAPLLIAGEVAITLYALRTGWFREKLAAWGDLARRAADLARWRRRVQASRSRGDRAVLRRFTGRIETPVLASPLLRLANPAMERYRRLISGA